MTIELTRLAVLGKEVPKAEVSLGSPLTVIAGSSNTGKSHIYQCIRFMLGGGDAPEGIPESDPYDRVQLELNLSGEVVLLERALRGGSFKLYRRLDQNEWSKAESLKAKHDAKKTDNVSQLLLSNCGLGGKEVRTNEWGDQRSLSFADLRKLVLVDEERIISRESVYLSGQRQDKPVEKSVLGLLLSGVDDSAIQPVERKKDRTSRLKTEMSLLSDLATETRELVGTGVTQELPDFGDQLKRLDAAIAEVTATVSSTQSEISELEQTRANVWSRLRPLRSRQLFLRTQVDRFGLLQNYYKSDRARLLAMIEAEDEVAALEEADCPVCGQTPSESTAGKSIGESLTGFKTACQRELAKIETQSKDLAATIGSLQEEYVALEADEQTIESQLREIDRNMNRLLETRQRDNQAELQELISRRAEVLRRNVLKEEFVRLSTKLTETQTLSKQKYEKPELVDKIDVRTTVGLCDEMQRLLEAWKFPDGNQVRFDPERQDFVIGKRYRGSLGKGYRAVVYAAFSIGLMRYCLTNQLHHPGFVVIDTPLNPLKGPDEGEAGKVNNDTKSAFYDHLSKASLGQVIILENFDPAEKLQKTITYHHFSQNTAVGRYGFYPINGEE